jgi:hypothetical protein
LSNDKKHITKDATIRTAPAHVDYFHDERVLSVAMILIVAFWMRVQDLGFTTAYMDESVYVVYGRMFLHHHFEAPLDSPLRWSFGWYLWPMISAWADSIGGIVAIRFLTVLGGTAAVAAVYAIGKRLYGAAAGLGGAAIFAVAAPAILASRIATRDAGTIPLFVIGLYAWVRAWQDRKVRWWFTAFVLLFASFLCKYLVAIFFPFLVILALWRGWRSLVFFCLPMTASAAVYLLHYWGDLKYLLVYGQGYSSLSASGDTLLQVYVYRRLDLWMICAIALLAFFAKGFRRTSLLLWLGAAIALAFQWKTRSDFDFWKHAAYPLIFLSPVAAYGIVSVSRKLSVSYSKQITFGVVGVVALCSGIAVAGSSTRYTQTVFWPNVEPILAYFEGRLPNNANVLIDDSVFRYYWSPMLSQRQMVDPFYFHYGEISGQNAYRKAVEDGWFDYIIYDAGMGTDAETMHNTVRSAISEHYVLKMAMPDPVLAHPIEIYERVNPPASSLHSTGRSIEITWPRSGDLTTSPTRILGRTTGAPPSSYVKLEVLSNRWYEIGNEPLDSTGAFISDPVSLGGQGAQSCQHMFRARLYDRNRNPLAVAVSFNVARSGSGCRKSETSQTTAEAY